MKVGNWSRGLVAIVVVLGGCSESPTQRVDAALADSAPTRDARAPVDVNAAVDLFVAEQGSVAPILDEHHPGWGVARCDDCHNLPERGHTITDPSACAGCHGGNGACAPNGENSAKDDHVEVNDCTSCHGQQHRFTAPSECVSCHFAAQGRRVCPAPVVLPDAGDALDGGSPKDTLTTAPVLSDQLEDNCLDWPATPFSVSNQTGWITQVSDGQLAIDFDLLDTDGNAHQLSQLLAERPVWLHLGSYT